MTANDFNVLYPVGTTVKYHPIIGGAEFIETKTRSEAWHLGHGEAVVKIEGRAGGVSLRALELPPVKISQRYDCPDNTCGGVLHKSKRGYSEYYQCPTCHTEWHWSEVHEAGDPLAAAL